MRWSQQQRMNYISNLLIAHGRVNRSQLVDKFGVTVALVSSDLATYQRLHPDAMRYDRSDKAWVVKDVSTIPAVPADPPAPGQPPLTPGDVAYLKSGSSPMTVEKVDEGGVTLVWMVYETKELRRDTLPLAVLKRDYN